MLLRAQFRSLVAEQLRQAGIVDAQQIAENRALPTAPDRLPFITLSTPHEVKQASMGRGSARFNTTIALRLDIRVTAKTDEDTAVLLERMVEMIELAILANAAVTGVIQEWSAVETSTTIDVTGKAPIGDAVMIVHAQVPQFYTPAADPLCTIRIQSDASTGDTPLVLLNLAAGDAPCS